jgi:fused signal recognition particle receptor
MVAGVNGAGKTTSIAKLAALYVGQGKKVLLAASDTFRAAAVEQLEIWAERVGADIVKNESADPAAVAFDAAEKALANGYDVLIIDTAGRLHTRSNLMMELQKVHRVVGSRIPGAPHETLMVLDANTGQNAVSQALRFSESIDVTGIILAKLDGTAKGGIVFGMRHQVDVPVKFIGLGEKAGDLMAFDPDHFVDALFS